MIVECLQKDPTKRPTASELLKHSFFKKAKDRKYLSQTLVAIGPSMETRVHKVIILTFTLHLQIVSTQKQTSSGMFRQFIASTVKNQASNTKKKIK